MQAWAEALLCGGAWWGEEGRGLIFKILEMIDGFFILFSSQAKHLVALNRYVNAITF